MQTLHLVRGVPGSGKSTLAKSLGVRHLETDMFFMRGDVYQWRPFLLGKAHAWCQEKTREFLAAGEDVAVANTFVKRAELQPYIKMAQELGIPWVIHNCTGSYENEHGVSPETIAKMRRGWQDVEDLRHPDDPNARYRRMNPESETDLVERREEPRYLEGDGEEWKR
jgi:predicted kinase